MNKILVKGTQNFLGKEIPVVEGGFGEGKRCLTDKTIAEIHSMQPRNVRARITDNLKRFKEDIDVIDLKRAYATSTLIELGYAKQSITQAEHIYLLSERGYAKLIKIMDTDLAWEIHDKLIDEYFTMREIINSDEQLKAQLLLEIYNGGQSGVLASKQLTELEKKPLLDKIEKQKPKVNWFDDFLNSEGTYNSTQVAKLFKLSSAQKLNKILNEKKIIYKKGTNWLPYSDVDKSWYKLIVGSNNEHNYSQLKFSPKGVYEISKLLEIEFEEEDLENLA
jgi:phage antirepressor YoqD-like protein